MDDIDWGELFDAGGGYDVGDYSGIDFDALPAFDVGDVAGFENLGGLDYSQFNLDSDLFGTGFEDDISSALQFSGDTGTDLSAYLASSPGGDYFGQEDLAEADLMRKLQEYQQLPNGGVQDLGAQGTLTDEGLLKIGGYDRPGGFTSQWQTTPSGERVFLYDESGYYDGKPVGQTGIGVRVGDDGRLGDTRSLTTSQIQDMIKKGELNTFKSGYFGATGGTKIAPGGGITTTTKDGTNVVVKPDGKIYDTDTGKVVTDTKTIKEIIEKIRETGGTGGVSTKPGLQQQNLLSSLLPLLLMMLAMNRGGGSSGQGSSAVIPGLTATQKQTPYTQIQQAPGYRPGQGGITYFNPVQYAPRMASGGIVALAEGGFPGGASSLKEMLEAKRAEREARHDVRRYMKDERGGGTPNFNFAGIPQSILSRWETSNPKLAEYVRNKLGAAPVSTAPTSPVTPTSPVAPAPATIAAGPAFQQSNYAEQMAQPGYRPGQGGVNFFSQMPIGMAEGGVAEGGLSKDSTAQEIADAYKSYIGTAGGDRPETQAAAVNFLRDLGIGDETIMSGYQTFLGNPPASTAANTAATTTATEGASTTQAPPVDYATQILEKKLAELAPSAYQEKGSVPYRVRELMEDALKGIMPESEADKELLNRQLYSSTTLRDAASKLGYDYDKEGIGSLLTNVNFNQRDPRNWMEILRADDPIAAARAATGQAIMGGAFSNADPRERAYQGSPVARSGNVGLFEVSTPSGTYLQPRFLTPEGLIKGNAYTSSDIGGFTTGARNLGLGVTQADIDALKAKAAAYYAGTSKPRGYDAEASMSFLNNLKPVSAGYAGSTPNYLIPGMNPSIYSGVEWSPNAARAPGMAGGGVIDLARALAAKRREQRQGLLKGRGDGVSDSIPAMIGRDQPARLARGEYVVYARTVAELGNGSTDAGAERLDEMRKRVHAKRKKAKVGEDSGAHKVLPA